MCIWETGPDLEYDRVSIKSEHAQYDLSFGRNPTGGALQHRRTPWRGRKTKVEFLTEALQKQQSKPRREPPQECPDCKRLKEVYEGDLRVMKNKLRCSDKKIEAMRDDIDIKAEELLQMQSKLQEESKARRAAEQKRQSLEYKVETLLKQVAQVRQEGVEKTDNVKLQLDALREVYSSLKQEYDEVKAEMEFEPDEDETGNTAVTRDYEKLFERLRAEIGLTYALKLPTREFQGDASLPTSYTNWRTRSTQHISAILKDRPLVCVVDALKASGHFDKILELPEIRRALAKDVIINVQGHWGARLAVHLWDRLDLSRSQYDTLRHLLSFQYDPKLNEYNCIKVWENPDDPEDFISMAALAGRHLREAEYERIVAGADIVVSEKGSCSRSATKAAAELYSNYASALRKTYTNERPAQPVLVVDGTGQSLSKALTHAELGSADFTGECKQSRKTLQPLAAYSDNDHTLPLREHLGLVARTYNQLIKDKCIERLDGTTIHARPICSADMQGVKSLTAQSEGTHSVWCSCSSAEDGSQHAYPTKAIPMDLNNIRANYKKMIDDIERSSKGPRCKFKTFDDVCHNNHYCPSVARGGKFKRFKCPHCGYNPTEKQWRKDLDEFDKLAPEQQKVRRKEHNEIGKSEFIWSRHEHGTLFLYPLLHLDMEDIGVDQLHLIYLNIFKHLFRYTIHDAAPDKVKRTILKDYIAEAGFYSYDAAADDEDPCKRWIGREVKRFLKEAHQHLPFLLNVANAPPEVCDSTINALDEITNGDQSRPPLFKHAHCMSSTDFPAHTQTRASTRWTTTTSTLLMSRRRTSTRKQRRSPR